MAQHKSSKKRIRQDIKIRLRNRYYKKSARTSIAKLRSMTDKKDAETFLPKVISMVDRLAKKNTWHKNKASNLKSKLTKFVNSLYDFKVSQIINKVSTYIVFAFFCFN